MLLIFQIYANRKRAEVRWELAPAGTQYLLAIVFWFISAFVTFILFFLHKRDILNYLLMFIHKKITPLPHLTETQ